MEILHPYLTLGYILLGMFSFREVMAPKYVNYKAVWWVIVWLIFVGGLRTWGPDYKSYLLMYRDFGQGLPFSYAAMKQNFYGVEWLYVLYNKIIYLTGLPFVFFTVLTAIFTICGKFWVFEKNSAYPALTMLLYLTPTFFMGDMGHLRQSIATTLTFMAFYAINERKLLLFLGMMYVAVGFHSSSFIFLPAYYLAVVPLKRWMIVALILLCGALSPLEIYNYLPMDAIAPAEIAKGFENYIEIIDENSGVIKFTDLLSLFYLYFILFYDRDARKIIPYYEYMRNLGVAGICIYLIFRSSPIFSTRLVSYYLLYMIIVVPNIIAAVKSIPLRRYLYAVVMLFVLFYYLVFANMQGKREFTPATYRNLVLPF